MKKQYQDIVSLIKEFGFGEAISHKILEFGDKYPLANRLFPEFIIRHTNSSAYSRSYITQCYARKISIF